MIVDVNIIISKLMSICNIKRC